MTVQVAKYPDGKWRASEGGKARDIVISADALFGTADDTVAGHVVEWSDGEDPDPSDGGIVVINDQHWFDGTANSKWRCRYAPEYDDGNPATACYFIYMSGCPGGY